MQAHLEERTPVCKDRLGQAARATGFSILPSAALPPDSLGAGPGEPWSQHQHPKTSPAIATFPLGVGCFAFGSLSFLLNL